MRAYWKKRLVALAVCVAVILYFNGFFLRAPLNRADPYHLARVLIEWQRFPVVSLYPGRHANKTIVVKVDEKVLDEQVKKLPMDLDKYPKPLSFFQPTVTQQDRKLMLLTIETFVRACAIGNLLYITESGTLLGSYRHHGFIPWDDDIDVIMNGSEWKRIRDVLSRVSGFELYTPTNVQWKFYLADLPPLKGEPFKWPHLDIFFFQEDSTHVWGLTADIKLLFFYHKSDIFPLQTRPFEHLQLQVPCNAHQFLFDRYTEWSTCMTLSYSHKRSIAIESSVKVPCETLFPVLPFVFREIKANGEIVEVLKIGDKILKSVLLPPQCKSSV